MAFDHCVTFFVFHPACLSTAGVWGDLPLHRGAAVHGPEGPGCLLQRSATACLRGDRWALSWERDLSRVTAPPGSQGGPLPRSSVIGDRASLWDWTSSQPVSLCFPGCGQEPLMGWVCSSLTFHPKRGKEPSHLFPSGPCEPARARAESEACSGIQHLSVAG